MSDTPEPGSHTKMDRFEKMNFLRETTPVEFHTKNVFEEMLCWIGESDFNEFYEHLCSCWNVCRNPEELEQRRGS